MATVSLSFADGVATLTFDRPGSAANLFDTATLRELDAHLATLEKAAALRGVILMSAKDNVFIAGADLKEIAAAAEAGLTGFLALGQDVFNRLERLPVPTVAAIHGACVGGGFEVALACRHRVASDDRSTKIGLPETKLGIIPAWGGSTRLPRLIGVAKALDIVLGGKTPDARKAKKLGMVDRVVPREHLREAALRFIAENRPAARAGGLRVALESWVVPRIAARNLRAVSRGHYPALEEAVRVVSKSRGSSLETSLRRERDAVAVLAQGAVCRNLLRLFFLTEKAKKSPPGTSFPKPASVAVIGAGVMGAGIAQWCAAKGLRVLLRDIDAAKVAAGVGRVRRLSEGNRAFSPREVRDLVDRVVPCPTPVPLTTAFVIEAAVERMDLKKKVFADLEERAGPETVLATNTSALSVTVLASVLKRPERLVGIHFFNPVHRMALVEIVVGRETSPEVAARAADFTRRIGKLPVIVKDSPGFAVNRILMPYLIEAARFFDRGADPAAIDGAMLDFGMPMGPLRLIDEVGLDVAEDVAATLAGAFGDRLAPPAALGAMLKAGLTGRKAGRGFFLYGGKGEPAPNPEAVAMRSGAGDAAGLSRDDLRRRMVALMVNEAARCLDEGVAASADDIDFAMVMGTGFAPFRGGPLRYADERGLRRLAEEMRGFGPGYEPCALLAKLAAENGRFHRD